jgi:acyl-CoA synthetase (NDP forming)
MEFEARYMDQIVRMMEKYNKPVFDVCMCMSEKEQTVYQVKGSLFKAVSYPTPERAVKAFAKMHEYHRFLARQ